MGYEKGISSSSKGNKVSVPPRRGDVKIKIFKKLLKKFGFVMVKQEKKEGGSKTSFVCPL
jgi:hypothetical protein